jgi:hypothetical protein
MIVLRKDEAHSDANEFDVRLRGRWRPLLSLVGRLAALVGALTGLAVVIR